MKFEDYKLDASICEALHTLCYKSTLPVQEAVQKPLQPTEKV